MNKLKLRNSSKLKILANILGIFVLSLLIYRSWHGESQREKIKTSSLSVSSPENNPLTLFELDPIKQLLHWEFFVNPVNIPERRGRQVYHFKYFLIPEDQIEIYADSHLNKKIAQFFVLNKNGKNYIKFPINDEDSLHFLELKKYLANKGLDSTIYKDQTGVVKTASRSNWYYTNKRLKEGISGKVSTNKTGGHWSDKKVNFNQIFKARLASDLTDRVQNRFKMKNLELLNEPLGFSLDKKGINHGAVFRNYDSLLLDDKSYYLPGFSALHDEFGENLAKINGSNNPTQFWIEHYFIPLGLAQAELAAYTSLSLESAHSQQYLIHLNHKGIPTGKIAFRDYNDSYVLSNFYNKTDEGKEFLSFWLDKYGKKNLYVTFGVDHGSVLPKWFDRNLIPSAISAFFNAFETRFSEITNIPQTELSRVKTPDAPILEGHALYLMDRLPQEKELPALVKLQDKIFSYQRSEGGEIEIKELKLESNLEFKKSPIGDFPFETNKKYFLIKNQCEFIASKGGHAYPISFQTKNISYRSKSYDTTSVAFKKWFAASECFQGKIETSNHLNCDEVFDCYYEKNQFSRFGNKCKNIMTLLLAGNIEIDHILSKMNTSQSSCLNKPTELAASPLQIKEQTILDQNQKYFTSLRQFKENQTKNKVKISH